MRTPYEIFYDPVFYLIASGMLAVGIFVMGHWFKDRHRKVFDDEVVESNIRRLMRNKNLNVSIESINKVMKLLGEVDELKDLLKDEDLNHYEIQRQIYDKIMECVQIYRRAGVPENRITQIVPISKF